MAEWKLVYGDTIDLTLTLNDPVSSLRFIGPLMTAQLRAEPEHIQTLRQLKQKLASFRLKTRATQWLKRVLRNRRSQRCVGRANAGAHYGRNHRFHVNLFNVFAFNAIVHFMRNHPSSHHPSAFTRKLPSLISWRRANRAFPNIC